MSMGITSGRYVRTAIAAGLLVAGLLIAGLLALPVSAAKRAPKPAQRSEQPPKPAQTILRPTPFSSGPLAGMAPPGWVVQTLPKVERQTAYDLVPDNGTIVLRARANASASSLRHGLFADPARTPMLRWRWRTERVLEGADMTRKDGDDYAARLCVFFDRDPETLPLKARTRLKFDRARNGNQVPAAALCYVWDNRHPVGTIMDSPQTPLMALVVASSGDANVGRWQSLQRNLIEDYQRAFNTAPPRIIAVSVGVDTEQTGESTTTWFSDVEFVGGIPR